MCELLVSVGNSNPLSVLVRNREGRMEMRDRCYGGEENALRMLQLLWDHASEIAPALFDSGLVNKRYPIINISLGKGVLVLYLVAIPMSLEPRRLLELVGIANI
ncbi:hypothetical protein BDV12DRAFT_160844 [Aspergillus spectabilis]